MIQTGIEPQSPRPLANILLFRLSEIYFKDSTLEALCQIKGIQEIINLLGIFSEL